MREFVTKEFIDKGWSADKKYRVTDEDGKAYLLRVTPFDKSASRKDMFRMQQEAASLGIPMCEPLEIGECDEGVYILGTWIDGVDAEEYIPSLEPAEQYEYGLDAGEILRRIHSIPAPEDQPDWEERFNKKMDRKIAAYRTCPIKVEGGEKFIEYIEANRHLLEDRPQSFQHGDYHIGNMMVEDGKLVIIDFDRYDFGDPWEEFNRIVWCAQKTPAFARGIVDGYFPEGVPEEFWRLLALYISSNTLSSVPWALDYGGGEVEVMLGQVCDILEWYDGMTRVVPSWYFPEFHAQHIDGVRFIMKEPFDFGFLGKYGRVFKVFDDQDSGNICFGTEKNGEKYFVKFGGARTKSYDGEPKDAIERLKATLPVYSELKHDSLIEFVDAEEIGGGFAMIFKWAEGNCMGRMYPEAHRRFMQLQIETRMQVFWDILSFLEYVMERKYVAIDFYDGSIMYDEASCKTTICDIDFFRRQPVVNDMGRMWGSSRFQSPEEYELGAAIDEITNVYTIGATAFALFSDSDRSRDAWPLSEALYEVASKATSDKRESRQQSVRLFIEEWENAAGCEKKGDRA